MFPPDSPLSRIPDYSFTLSKRPRAFPSDVWTQATGGVGPHIYLADRRVKMLDWMCALGALTVGHAHPDVVKAVSAILHAGGAITSLPHWLEAVVSQRLCDIIPCAEQVRVVKTGSEACSAAVRIARMATGRRMVLTTETSYHGWHDGFMAAKERHPGVPEILENLILTFKYNDMKSFDDAAAACEDLYGRPAAVILEPVQGEAPEADFLRKLVHRAHVLGAVVIFDEMLCGGRLALAGAQEYYGVVPDMATFGKALGGGLPFAFVCGKADIMQHAWPVSGTFSGDGLALAAADAMLTLYQRENVIERLWQNGRILQEALLQVSRSYDLTLVLHGHAPRFWLNFAPNVDKRLALSVFSQQAAKRGQLVHPAVIFASAAMTTQQATEGASALAEALEVVCAGIKADNLMSLLEGDMYQDSVR